MFACSTDVAWDVEYACRFTAAEITSSFEWDDV